jgi:putative ABC transport system substrate-binding protein
LNSDGLGQHDVDPVHGVDVIPDLIRPDAPASCRASTFLEQVHLAGRTSGIEIAPVAMARGPEEVENAVATIAKAGAHGLVVQGIFFSQLIADLTMKHRLPAASVLRQFAMAGGLLSYGADVPDIFRRSALLVHRVLQGTNPASLPVELPTKFELVINLKTAKTLGIAVPPTFLARADEVIE